MTAYRNKYLDMIKAENSKKCLGKEPSKPSKLGFEGFDGKHVEAFSEKYAPSLNPDGVPIGGCPSCARGEFWRWPKFHHNHDARGWVWVLLTATGRQRTM